MRLLTIEEITDIPLFAMREQLRLDQHREEQRQIVDAIIASALSATAEWLMRQEYDADGAA
jgi:hypothetical protein